jgi:hypothetical protein
MSNDLTQRFCTTKFFRKNYLPISDNKLRELIHAGAPCLHVGRKFMIPIQKFLDYLENEAINAK